MLTDCLHTVRSSAMTWNKQKNKRHDVDVSNGLDNMVSLHQSFVISSQADIEFLDVSGWPDRPLTQLLYKDKSESWYIS